jgi:putative transposase
MPQIPPAPPGFTPFDLNKSVRRYIRHLPHWREDGATYFVTFRLADSLPDVKLKELRTLRSHWEHTCPEPRTEDDWRAYAREVIRHAEKWLDEGHGECHFREQRWINDLNERLQYFNGSRYQLSCSVIMPNHCHAIIRPFDGYELENLLGQIKGVTARHLNVALGRQNELWEQECYDRIIRDAEHLYRVVQYIGRNPAALNIPKQHWPLWLDPLWEQAGWGFVP